MRSRSLALFLVALSGLACAGRSEKNAITASGTIEAIEVNVASKVAGQILTLAVEEGARVRPGDVLATIDHATADIQLRQAEAGVDLARAQLALLRNGARREDIQQAEAALKQTEANLQLAAEDARRMRELFRTASVTAKQRDDAEARLTIAEAQRASATEALSKVRQTGPARGDRGGRSPAGPGRGGPRTFWPNRSPTAPSSPRPAGSSPTRPSRPANWSPRARRWSPWPSSTASTS